MSSVMVVKASLPKLINLHIDFQSADEEGATNSLSQRKLESKDIKSIILVCRLQMLILHR